MSYHVLTGASEILPSYAAVIHMHNNTANGLGFLITYNVETLIIIIIIIADNKSFQRELTSPLTSIKLNNNNIKSLVSCRAVKFSKEKGFQLCDSRIRVLYSPIPCSRCVSLALESLCPGYTRLVLLQRFN